MKTFSNSYQCPAENQSVEEKGEAKEMAKPDYFSQCSVCNSQTEGVEPSDTTVTCDTNSQLPSGASLYHHFDIVQA